MSPREGLRMQDSAVLEIVECMRITAIHLTQAKYFAYLPKTSAYVDGTYSRHWVSSRCADERREINLAS
ncbi:hypothetical protein HG15A2_33430 [Adhaeretor mobilis]|uniref:Uncharacterized protein n=1 Tax=Adhaeretor mobilis TaxID=1930276 RepID=A0A517MYW5_9BACT|nr:hypothetical protein HG15A2_33430 [Adhaeretor mobilis]